MPTIAANGLDVGYEVRGDGAPIVMLHGATSSAREDWAAQAPLLARSHRVYLPDARGHATTRWDAADGWSGARLVDDLGAFLDAIGLDAVHLVGFSMGAHTALGYAIREPSRVRSLVIGGISTQHEPRASVARRLMDPARIEREDPAWAAQLAARHDPVQGPGAWRRLLAAIVADVTRQPVVGPRDLRRVEAPTLVAAGDRDPFVPIDHAWGLQRQLPDGRLLVVPDCGHEVMVCRAGLFNEALASFYRSTDAVGGRRSGRRIARAPATSARPPSGPER